MLRSHEECLINQLDVFAAAAIQVDQCDIDLAELCAKQGLQLIGECTAQTIENRLQQIGCQAQGSQYGLADGTLIARKLTGKNALRISQAQNRIKNVADDIEQTIGQIADGIQ